MSEKFLKSTDLETGEVKQVITECVLFLKEKLAPALDLLSPSTVERLTNQFLLEKKAEFKLDELAVEDGYESEADRQKEIQKKARDKEASELAAKLALEKAQREEEEAAAKKLVEEEAAAQVIRDKEDADREAVLKASLKASGSASASLNL